MLESVTGKILEKDNTRRQLLIYILIAERTFMHLNIKNTIIPLNWNFEIGKFKPAQKRYLEMVSLKNIVYADYPFK